MAVPSDSVAQPSVWAGDWESEWEWLQRPPKQTDRQLAFSKATPQPAVWHGDWESEWEWHQRSSNHVIRSLASPSTRPIGFLHVESAVLKLDDGDAVATQLAEADVILHMFIYIRIVCGCLEVCVCVCMCV